ncbi:MAG: SusC/RagA family TonB-linked outer membrane protein [Mucilaginibacter sp.]|uniref:SusC/RagA family TonB-linked outer membrane protein n=1 Tax=Mucilaginibacter sp. TaxID=1882438 RepID=UPI00326313C7
MKKIVTLALLSFLLLFGPNVMAQGIEITGKVVDATDGSVLPGVTVSVKGTATAIATDSNGGYRIKAPADATLVFNFIGYTRQEVAVKNQTTINVKLVTEANLLNEVTVNTGLGIAREERSLGYAAQGVNSGDLNANHQSNVVNALQGKVAGVTITSTGGGPGQGANIKIRGVNSIDISRDNQPLFVVDGILIDNSTSNIGAYGTSAAGTTASNSYNERSVTNRASDINPEDIETINVLKGGAATALYGLRGANGVIVITTKKGSGNGVQINFSSLYGFENPDKLPAVQSEYTAGILGVYTPIGLGPAWGPTVAEAIAIDPTHPAQLYNNYKQAYQTGHQARNTVTIAGGSDIARVYSSISYLKQSGMLPFTDDKNISARLNADIKLSPKLRGSLNLSFTNSGGLKYDADRFGESLAYFSPRWDVSNFMNPDGTQVWTGTNNPIFGAATNQYKDNVNRVIGGMTYTYSPFKWLDLSYRLGIDTYNLTSLRTAPAASNLPNEHTYDNGLGFVGEYGTKFRTLTSTLIATFTHKITNDLNATVRIGQDIYDKRQVDNGVTGTNLAVYNYFNLKNAQTLINPVDNLTEYHLSGVFGEADFDYKKYLYLTLTLRNDITSTLPANNRSFYYPSASLSYVFSDNFKMPEWISFGKLRASYAQLGKDADPYSFTNGFAAYTNLAASSTGTTRSSTLGNATLKPEFTNTYEGGLEMSFLNKRIGFDVTYYYSLSKDQIIRADVSSATGYVQAYINAGTMRNRGIELILKGSPVRSKTFNWDASVNFSANQNLVLTLPEGLTSIPYGGSSGGYLNSPATLKLIAGQPYGNIYGTVWQRYYGSDAENATFTDKNRPMLIGANGFPVLAPASTQKLLGNSQPKWIGSFSNTFSYKNFSLTALFDARWGFQRFNRLDNFFAAFGIADYTSDRRQFKVFDGVTANGQPNTKSVYLGQAVGPDGVNYGEGYYRTYYRAISEPFVEDASWIRLRAATLAYSIPAKYLPKGLRSTTASVTGNNLWLHTKYYGLDPESVSSDSGSNVDGFSGFTYPAARQVIFTLNVGF